MTQNILIFIGYIGSAISVVLSLLYILTGISSKKQNEQIINKNTQTKDFPDACKIVDTGTSMDNREIFVCQVKMQEEVV